MGRTVLVMFPLEAGNQLLDALDKDGFDVRAALWLYYPESDTWRLTIASPLVDKIGPLESYKRIVSKLQGIRETLDPDANEIYMNDVTIVSPTSGLIRALGKVAHVKNGERPIRLTRSAIENIFVDEAYIYRLLG